MCKHALIKALLRLEYKVLERSTLNLSECAWKWEFTVEEREEMAKQQQEIAKKKALVISRIRQLD